MRTTFLPRLVLMGWEGPVVLRELMSAPDPAPDLLQAQAKPSPLLLNSSLVLLGEEKL